MARQIVNPENTRTPDTDNPAFTLRIEGIRPDDLATRRFVAYLDEFARLLGEEASTRFGGLYSGSVILKILTPLVAVPKVRARLAAARDDTRNDAHRRVSRLDEMLAEDNASGSVSEDGQSGVIIHFAGARARDARLPAVTEPGTIQGVLVRIGGRDDTAHAMLLDGDRTYNCVVSRDTARALAKHLFGPPLRLHGRGRWRRTSEGKWELVEEGFQASDFEVLDPASLRDAAEKLRETGGLGLSDDAETWTALRDLRGEE